MEEKILNSKLIKCDSKSDLESRIKPMSETNNSLPLIITEDIKTWCYFHIILKEKELFIPIGYANVGIEPIIILVKNKLLIGIDELVIAFDIYTKKEIYRQKLSTIFHEFVYYNEYEILIREEIGFLCIGVDGVEKWSFYVDDIIKDFKLKNSLLQVNTIEEEFFEYNIPVGVKIHRHPT